MKLIDEKGRLFGKINLIDLLVVLLIVAVLAAVVWKLGGSRAAAAVAGTEKKAVYTVEFEDVSADIAEYAKTQVDKTLVNDSKQIAPCHYRTCAQSRTTTSLATCACISPSRQAHRLPAMSTRSGRRRSASAMNTSSRRANLS